MPTRIQPTIDALQGNLTDSAPKRGAELIGRWTGDLEDADWRGAKTIHADLVSLQHHLEGGAPDAAKIKDLLTKLDEATGRAAAHVEGNTQKQLGALAEALKQAGDGL